MEQPLGSDLSRRALLGRIGVGVAGTAVAVTGGAAALASPASAASGLVGTAGVTQYLNIGMIEFEFIRWVNGAAPGAEVQWGYVYWGGKQIVGNTTGYVHAPVTLPDGATITSVEVFMNLNSIGSTFAKLRRYKYPTGDLGVDVNFDTGSGVDILGEANFTSPANGFNAYSIPLNGAHAGEPINNNLYNYQIADINLVSTGPTTGMTIYGARVGYQAPSSGGGGGGGFTPHSEPRYDSRQGGGKISDGQERTHHVAPPGAGAAVITLTATGTTGGGYLAAFNAAVTWPGNSSVNWFGAGQSLATTVIAPVSPAGDIKIRGGGTAADYLIDVVGYL